MALYHSKLIALCPSQLLCTDQQSCPVFRSIDLSSVKSPTIARMVGRWGNTLTVALNIQLLL